MTIDEMLHELGLPNVAVSYGQYGDFMLAKFDFSGNKAVWMDMKKAETVLAGMIDFPANPNEDELFEALVNEIR